MRCLLGHGYGRRDCPATVLAQSLRSHALLSTLPARRLSRIRHAVRRPLLVALTLARLLSPASHLGACAAEGSAAATREKTVRFGITACAQGTTLGLSVLPNRTRFSHVSLRRLLPRRLLASGGIKVRVVAGDPGTRGQARRLTAACIHGSPAPDGNPGCAGRPAPLRTRCLRPRFPDPASFPAR